MLNSQHPYHRLSERQRGELPELTAYEVVPPKFEDSTNRLWTVNYRTDGGNEEAILKLCHPLDIESSEFWQGMKVLFGVSFPHQMADYVKVYELVSQWSPLKVPPLVAARSSHEDFAGCLLTRKLPGLEVQGEQLTKEVAARLGHHVGSLHRHKSERFGVLFAPQKSADRWTGGVLNAVVQLARQKAVSVEAYRLELEAFERTFSGDEKEFVPIMLDLRWDQFLIHQQQLHALVDLDAMVWGARELEFVLLEYLLDESLWQGFIDAYIEYRDLPELDSVRTVYRLLLFFMNVLGEESLEAWMSAPRRL